MTPTEEATALLAKITPGEWRLEDGSSSQAQAVAAKSFDGRWRWIVDRVRGGSPEQRIANGELIAAAPRLLRALLDEHTRLTTAVERLTQSNAKWGLKPRREE